MNPSKILWKPSEEMKAASNLHDFERWLEAEKGLRFESYEALWEWSIEHVADFWEALWQYFDIDASQPYREVLSSLEMPGATWFDGATLNYAAHIFRMQSEDRPALVFASERHAAKEKSWAELENEVKALQAKLLEWGIEKGDTVAAYLPNIPEAVVAFLAVNSIGAIWSCCSPDFGINTVIDRFEQIEPRVFIAADGYTYGGKSFDRLDELEHIEKALPSIEKTILVSYLNEDAAHEGAIDWQDIVSKEIEGVLAFLPVPFNHPIWVLYSSGTTGKPKAITHSHGGVLLEHLKYLYFHNDAHEGEHFFWFTTTGWMMWNFLQASMLVGAIPVFYDGSPGYPDLNTLWQLAESLPIHHFGTSAPYLTACMKKELSPGAQFDLSKLRSIGSTGAPLPPEAFDWVYAHVSSSVWLCSMSGGTDVCTAFVGGCPYEPVYKGLIQCRCLGCAMKAYDDEGHEVLESLGEMVVEIPMPSMPVFFWNDPDDARYRASYFEKYPGKWRHGDWIKVFENGSLIIQGRSDATLNRKGVRIGTAEIYAIVDGLEGVRDSLVLNLEKERGGDVMPLFVVLNNGFSLDEPLQQQIKTALKSQGSPRHVPDFIVEVPDIPYTLSGKKMEVPVKKVLMGIAYYQRPETRDQRPETRDQRPETRDQRPETRDQRPETRDQRPETRKEGRST